ncbi:hypothetical protein Slin15195_G025390 [Septoria linicola]|uniref:PBP domain-containing protein n=1 Tax=Septoria linicola TaxID=215465 RepID=A0A9Q9AHK7_9PEZI|nr:hypothetical protein Slin15195_G025390 [Septoria linicola]
MASSAPGTRITITDPRISRHHSSQLLEADDGPAGSESIDTADHGIYGDPYQPIRFRMGNGGAGYTGILRVLAEAFISEQGNSFRIGWVSNHSRHTQIALLADVVQVALTYEPDNEDLAIREGWARRVGRAFNDHFLLVGPSNVDLHATKIGDALKAIVTRNAHNQEPLLFHSRGDGSATFAKETWLWQAAGLDVANRQPDWIKIDPLTPYDALVKAEKEQAFLLTDRATFLTAKQDGRIPLLAVHVEGGPELLNPCSVLVRAQWTGDTAEEVSRHDSALSFAKWLTGSRAQEIVRGYGRDWKGGKPLFTVAGLDDFKDEDRLGRVPVRGRTPGDCGRL